MGINKIDSLSLVKQMHAQLVKMPKLWSYDDLMEDLITGYLRLCDFESALIVFYVGFSRNFVMWRWFFEEFRSFGGDPVEILRVFGELHRKGVNFDCEIHTVVLKISAILMDKWLGVEVHGCLIKKGFDLDVHLKCALMNFYGRCWGTDYADKVFDEMPEKDASLWNEVIVAAIMNGVPLKALQLFREMQFSSVKSDVFTVGKGLQACGKAGALEEGRQLHGYVIRNEMDNDVTISNSLISMYSKNNKVEHARKIFDSLENRNISSWNSMISGYASLGYFDEAIKLFHEMDSRNVKPDLVTWNCLLSSHLEYGLCHRVLIIFRGMVASKAKPNSGSVTPVIQAISELKSVKLGKEMHCYVIRNGLHFDLYVQTTLLDMYVKIDELVKAQAIFDLMKNRNIVGFNSLIAGYSSKGLFDDATKLLNQMQKDGIKPDIVTWNSLVYGYSLNGHLNDALSVLDKMTNFGTKPNVISWTALISGASQNGKYEESFNFFGQMVEQGVKPNSVTVTSLSQSSAGMSWLQKGREIHCWCVRNGVDEDVSVATALVHMYIKSGSLETAFDVFLKIKNRNVATWNCMLMGFAVHNRGKEGIMLFDQMVNTRILPDAITFTAVLSCCKNSGLLGEGWRYFDTMKERYNIVPTIEHYSCMIDLLGKAGYLDEAWDFIQTMPVKPDASVWGSILQSCRVHNNLTLGKIAAKNLFELEPNNSANYVLMMNLYSMSNKWEDVDRLREQMLTRGVKIQLGWSWIQVKHEVHVFNDENRPHPEIGNIYYELYQLVSEMKNAGYIPDIKSVYQDIDDTEKEKVLLTHTEKLAITYGLMKLKNGSPIRVIKSTRMCSDCHIAAKYMSLIRNREIIVKDGVRFHHFRDGSCSCRDCW
ncbi:hypothetical protein RND81_01G189800 [Saponaria officinalis]